MESEGSHYARVVGQAFLDDFHVLERDVAAGTHLETHQHPRGAITMTLDGEGLETTPFGTRRFAKGSLDYRPAGLPHSNLVGPFGCRVITIEIASDRMVKFESLFDRPYDPIPLHADEFGDLPARIRRELHSVDRYRGLRLKAAILELVARGSRVMSRNSPSRAPDWLLVARHFIQQSFTERISLTDVARFAGVDPVTMARTHKRCFGITVGDAIRDCRLTRAANELLETADSVVEIAGRAGFYDASHMIRTFEANAGMTPSAFRKSHQSQAAIHG